MRECRTAKLCLVPTRYESIIATLCENLDSLDEPDARAAMIWIVGEYAERIDNADELLESFLEGFHDESTQVLLVCPAFSRPVCHSEMNDTPREIFLTVGKPY